MVKGGGLRCRLYCSIEDCDKVRYFSQAVMVFRSRLSHGVRPGPQRCSLPLRWYLTRLVLGMRYLQLTLGTRRGGFKTSLTLLGLREELRESIVDG